jgi:cytochrome b
MKSSTPPTAVPAAGSPAPGGTEAGGASEARIWDAPVRLFHWLLVLLLGLSWYTGEVGGLDEMTWHMWSGYAVLALVLARVAWGLVGSTTARFGHFLYGPGEAIRYAAGLARRKPPHYPGHTPLGGWMIALMLACLLVQTATGLFANDDIFTEGPLLPWVSKEVSDWLTTMHKWNFELLLVLAGVHVAAVAFYAVVLRQNLVKAMFTGRKPLAPGEQPPPLRFANPVIAIAIVACTATGVWLLVRSGAGG